MAEKQILSLKLTPRFEQVGDEYSECVQDRKHRYQGCDDSALQCDSRSDGIFENDRVRRPRMAISTHLVAAQEGQDPGRIVNSVMPRR
jgi:hypothetical protein